MNVQNVNKILDALAVRFGTTTELLWEMLIRQVWVEFWTSMVFVIVAIPVSVMGVRWALAQEKDDLGWTTGTAFTVGLISLLFLLAAVVTFFGFIGHPLNPEYYALKMILGAF